MEPLTGCQRELCRPLRRVRRRTPVVACEPVLHKSTTGVSSSELLLGRRPRSRLDLLNPHLADRIEENQKQHHHCRCWRRNFNVGDDVFVRNYHRGDKWIPGVIEQKTGPVSYRVKVTTGGNRRCHEGQVRKRSVDGNPLYQN